MLGLRTSAPTGPEPVGGRSESRAFAFAGLLVVLSAAFCVYHGALAGFFVQDDFGWLGDSRFRSFGAWFRCFFRFNPALTYRPLSQETFFWLGQQLFGVQPAGFHFLSMAIHLADAALVYMLLRKFCPKLPCLVGAFFFAVHSAHFRSVYWISAVPEPMALAFYLTSFLFFIRFDRERKPGALVLSTASMALGMMSKESLLSLPLVLAAYTLFFSRKRILWTLPHFFIAGVYVLCRMTSPAVKAAPYALTFGLGAWDNLLAYVSWAAGFTESLLKLTLKLEPESSYAAIAAGALIAGVLLLVFSKDRKVGLFAVVWFVLALQPVLYFVNHIYSYYLAPALPAFSLLLASAFYPLRDLRDWKRGALALAVTVFILSASAASVWKEGRWWNERAQVARTILDEMPEVVRQVPSGRGAYIFGFGDFEFGAMQNDAAFHTYGFSPWRFIQFGLDPRTAGQILHLEGTGDIAGCFAFLYSGGRFINVTDEFRRDPHPFLVIGTPPTAVMQVNSEELTAGRDTMVIRFTQPDARAIDLVYTVDDRELSRIRGWRLDATGSASVFVDSSTGKGLYHFIAVRDSLDPKGNWFSVDVRVRVK